MERESFIAADNYDFGARIMDARLGRWMSVDRHYYNYTGNSVYCFGVDNPIFYIDPDGHDVIAAIMAAVVSFVNDAGAQFLEGYLLRGESAYLAWENVNLWSSLGGALVDGLAKLPLPPGMGALESAADIANSKIGKVVSGVIVNITKEASNRYHQGWYSTNGEIDWDLILCEDAIKGLFIDAVISTFIDQGFHKKADELISQFRHKYTFLQKQYDKLHKISPNAPAKAVEKRIEKVDNAAKETLKTGGNVADQTVKKQSTTLVSKKVVGELTKDTGKTKVETDADKKQKADSSKQKKIIVPPPSLGGGQ
jgi:hypothetical protein